jgi:murein DD-endopeptidase MepM/ murein hydrolase activator NlpD
MERPDEPGKRRSNRKRAEQTAQTLIAALLLGTASGCATVDMHEARAPTYDARPMARPVTVVLVQRGDTVAAIARRFGLSSQAIINANHLTEPYHLTRGQRLVLPPSSAHFVAAGETVSSIARAYGVSRQAIVDANELAEPDLLVPGQRIAIPFVGPQQRAVARYVPRKVEAVEDTDADPRVDGGRYYAMKRPRPKPVFDGQGGPEELEPLGATKTAEVRRSTGRFIWPVQGKVISAFGRRDTGVHNDGINIACEPGAPVKAADSGTVVYDGNELAAYGNLLLVRHSSGFVTAYAHNKKLLVKRGDPVKQGQTIALAGSTGDVDRPQLHFEIRKGDRAVDPNRYLSRATASR